MFPEKSSTLLSTPFNGGKVTDFLRRKISWLLGGLGLILMVTATLLNHINSVQSPTKNPDTTNNPTSFSQKEIVIDIEGAVQQPGIYKIPEDSRIQDVLITAGGLTAKADRRYLSDNINLAQRVFDGMKIVIPLESENELGININSASENDLDQLPGVGPVTAKKIITGRPYQSVEELLTRKILSRSVFEKVKLYIIVN